MKSIIFTIIMSLFVLGCDKDGGFEPKQDVLPKVATIEIQPIAPDPPAKADPITVNVSLTIQPTVSVVNQVTVAPTVEVLPVNTVTNTVEIAVIDLPTEESHQTDPPVEIVPIPKGSDSCDQDDDDKSDDKDASEGAVVTHTENDVSHIKVRVPAKNGEFRIKVKTKNGEIKNFLLKVHNPNYKDK